MCPPACVKCCVCDKPCEDIVRCTDCGPSHYYCQECCTKLHLTALYHHCPEVWVDECFMALPMPAPMIFNEFHTCENTVIERAIICFCITGVPRTIKFSFCQCECDSLTMIRLRYWPATPSRPTIGFSFQLLDWLESLLLECQVAVQDMTQALSYVLKTRIDKLPCNLYPVVIDSFEEYRHFKMKLKSHNKIESSQGLCPACPKESGTVTISLDAVFGLCRKVSAGKSIHPPLSGTLIFEDQSQVDNFVDSYNPKEKSLETNECNNFLAGHALRSKSRYKALDETAVMGTVCRHEVPLRFFSLRHGERISYALYMMKCLRAQFPTHNIQLLYDIACTLDRHIKANGSVCDFDLAIPVFHCYGHKYQCQIQYGPRNKKGMGLSDGEGMERLWSYLRRFGRMTKEMRPSHRIDVLTDAILYYAKKAVSNLGKTLSNRMKHAVEVKENSEKKLQHLVSTSPASFCRDEVKLWLVERNEQFSRPYNDSAVHVVPSWKEKYVDYIDTYVEMRDAACVTPEDASIATKLDRIEEKLSNLEVEHSIVDRWLPGTIQYDSVKSVLKSRKKCAFLEKIQDLARERWYLLALKAKYADGLSIAARLARRITSVSKQIKAYIVRYNHSVMQQSEQLTWETATKLPHSNVSRELFPASSCSVPADIRRQAVEHLVLICRSSEEIERLKEEMNNCINYYRNLIEAYESEINKARGNPCQSRFTTGSICLMKKHIHQLHTLLKELVIVFSQWVESDHLLEYTRVSETCSLLSTFTQLSDAHTYTQLTCRPTLSTQSAHTSNKSDHRSDRPSIHMQSDRTSTQSNGTSTQSDHTSIRSDRIPTQSDHMPTLSDSTSNQSDRTPTQSDHSSTQPERTPTQPDRTSTHMQSDCTSTQSDRISILSDRTSTHMQSDYTPTQSDRISILSDHTSTQSDLLPMQSDHTSTQSTHTLTALSASKSHTSMSVQSRGSLLTQNELFLSVREAEKAMSTPYSDNTDSEDDEDSIFNPTQTWRGEMFLREEFMNSQCQNTVPMLSSSEQLLLEQLKSTKSSSTVTSSTAAFLGRMKHLVRDWNQTQ